MPVSRHLHAPCARSRPFSASVSFPWSTRSSSSPPPSAAESSSCFSNSRPWECWHHLAVSSASFNSVMLTHFSLLPFLLDFSLICPPPQPPAWLGTNPFFIDLPRSSVSLAWPALPCAWSPESSSMPFSPPFWAEQYDLQAAWRRQLLSFYSREFPWAHLWPRQLPDTLHHHSSLGHPRSIAVTGHRTFLTIQIVVEDALKPRELAGSSQVTRRPPVIDYFPSFME